MSMLPLKLAPSMMLTVGAKDISANLRRLLHENGFLRLQVAVHRALDDDELRADIRFDRALRTDGQALRVRDRSLDPPLESTGPRRRSNRP
jgi:hypothetical protein